jgi:5-methylcytosine-specific restriction endonuclease McrA
MNIKRMFRKLLGVSNIEVFEVSRPSPKLLACIEYLIEHPEAMYESGRQLEASVGIATYKTWNTAKKESGLYKNKEIKITKRPQRVKNSSSRTLIMKALPSEVIAWQEVLRDFNYSCAYCGKPQKELSTPLQQEHFVPLSKGGGYTRNNIIPACKTCNTTKRDKMPDAWLNNRPELYKRLVEYLEQF